MGKLSFFWQEISIFISIMQMWFEIYYQYLCLFNSISSKTVCPVSTRGHKEYKGICDSYMHHQGDKSCFSWCIYATPEQIS